MNNKTKQILVVLLLILVVLIIINNTFKLKRVSDTNNNNDNNVNDDNNENFTNNSPLPLTQSVCDDDNPNTIMISPEVNNDIKLSNEKCKNACKKLSNCSHYSLINKESNEDNGLLGNCKLYEHCIPKKSINEEDEINCVLDDNDKCIESRSEFPLTKTEFNKMKCKNDDDDNNIETTNNIDVCKQKCSRTENCNYSVYNTSNSNCKLYSQCEELEKSDNHKLNCRKPNKECSKLMRQYINTTSLLSPPQDGKRYSFDTKTLDTSITFK